MKIIHLKCWGVRGEFNLLFWALKASPELYLLLCCSQKFNLFIYLLFFLHSGNWSVKAETVSDDLFIIEKFPLQLTNTQKLTAVSTTGRVQPSTVLEYHIQGYRSSQLLPVTLWRKVTHTSSLLLGQPTAYLSFRAISGKMASVLLGPSLGFS